MSTDRTETAPGRAGTLRPSLPYVVSVIALILGLMATQVWPMGLSAAPAEVQPEDAGAAFQAQKSETLPRSGAVIVVFKPGAAAEVTRAARAVGARPTQVYGSVFPGFAARLPEQAIKGLARNPNVAFIASDLPVQAAAQSIPVNVRRSALNSNPTAAIDGVDNPINADIAIIDTGVNWHPDLRIAGGYNCTSSDRAAWGDSDGHGTHVAGTAAAIDNGIGVVGSAPGARIWSLKVLGADGGSTSAVICALDWVAANSNTIDVVKSST